MELAAPFQVEPLEIGAQAGRERHRRACLLNPFRLTGEGIERRAIRGASLLGPAGALQYGAAASEPGVFPRRSGCDAGQSSQRGVVVVQPQLEIDRFELERDDRAKASEPLVQASERPFERVPSGAFASQTALTCS